MSAGHICSRLQGGRLSALQSLALLILTAATCAGAAAQPADAAPDAQRPAPFRLAGHTTDAGSMQSFHVTVADTQIPITVSHGAHPGPVLTLTAGIHGDEYPPVLALLRLRATLDPRQQAGTLVLVHAANVAALHQYGLSALHPEDGRNLNREFPGNADGSPTQQIAHFFTTQIVPPTDYLIDMHSGSADQALWPHVYSPFVGDEELDARTLAFARATGMHHIVLYGDRPRDPARSISWPNTAMTRGKPGLTIEIGDRGRRDTALVDTYLTALFNAMRHLGFAPGTAPNNAGAIVYRKLHDVETPVRGLLHLRVEIGELVDEGTLLAVVTDYFGEPVAQIRSPVRGVVLMLTQRPPINAGAGVATIGTW